MLPKWRRKLQHLAKIKQKNLNLIKKKTRNKSKSLCCKIISHHKPTRLETVKPLLCCACVICLDKHPLSPKHYTVTITYNREEVFSHSTEFITWQADCSPASLLVLHLSSRWLLRKNYITATTSPPFSGSVDVTLRSSKSLLFNSGVVFFFLKLAAAENLSTGFLAGGAGAAH